jgi:hypothetical protein
MHVGETGQNISPVCIDNRCVRRNGELHNRTGCHDRSASHQDGLSILNGVAFRVNDVCIDDSRQRLGISRPARAAGKYPGQQNTQENFHDVWILIHRASPLKTDSLGMEARTRITHIYLILIYQPIQLLKI